MDIVARVKGLLLNPKAEWPAIEREPGDFSTLFSNYMMYVAAIPPVCTVIGSLLLSHGRFGLLGTIVIAAVGYVCGLIGVFVMAFVIDFLAGTFDGRRDFDNAMRVSAYSPTAAWVAGVFNLIPFLGFLAILGLYSIYLLHTGIVALMRPPADKALFYTVTAIVCMIVVWAVVLAVPLFIISSILVAAAA